MQPLRQRSDCPDAPRSAWGNPGRSIGLLGLDVAAATQRATPHGNSTWQRDATFWAISRSSVTRGRPRELATQT